MFVTPEDILSANRKCEKNWQNIPPSHSLHAGELGKGGITHVCGETETFCNKHVIGHVLDRRQEWKQDSNLDVVLKLFLSRSASRARPHSTPKRAPSRPDR